jgi:multidrug resistance efflux pump
MKSWSTRILLLGLIAIVLIGVLVQSQWSHEPLKVSGFIEADEIRLGSRVGGRVRAVRVEEGDFITAGKLLVELEPFDYQERRAEAEARREEQAARHRQRDHGYRDEEVTAAKERYRQLKFEYYKLKNGPRQQEIDAARAELESARATLRLEEIQHQNSKSLFERGVITREEFDRAEKELDAAKAEVQVRTEQLDLLNAGTREEDIKAAWAQMKEAQAQWQLKKNGYRQEERDQAYAALQAAEHAVAVIDQQIAELKITSPVSGTVQAVDLQPGDLINANAPVLSLLDTSHLWVRAYVPENELGLSIGKKVKVTVDSYPNKSFTGEISFVSREAEFTPRNVQTPEERSKQVFRIKVTLKDGLDRLRPGMGADVWLEP